MKTLFGRVNNKDIFVFELKNEFLKVEILNYGAIIKSIIFNKKNIVLGFNNLESYINDYLYTGCFIGRNAGRIKNSSFNLNGKIYKLDKNDKTNNLHSGSNCFNKYIFDYKEISNKKLELSLKINNMEDLFPGNLNVFITYELINNYLKINIKGISDKDTIFNPTYHNYFNLNGNINENILNHKLQINSDFLMDIDKFSIPTGKISKINNTFNFKTFKNISKNINDEILKNQKGFDHPYILRNSKENVVLTSENSKIKMSLKTDLPSLIFYSGNFIPEKYYNNFSVERCGLCLEPQYYPDFINNSFDNYILKKEKLYNHNISYKFDLNDNK
ncbi:MAG: aldose epimerase family protein [Thermotogota bacterium]